MTFCAELLVTAHVWLKLNSSHLNYMILAARPGLVREALDDFDMPWEIVREEKYFTFVKRMEKKK